MISWLVRFLVGYLEIQVSGNSAERLLNMCVHHNIRLRHLRFTNQMFLCDILRSDFKKLKPFMRKTNTKVKIRKKIGLPFVLFEYRKRKLLFLGAVICVVSIGVMSQHIWKIEVSGNELYSTEYIKDFLWKQGIQITMEKEMVQCDQIVSMIRNHFPNIIWVSAHVQGVELVVRVKEHVLEEPVVDENILLEKQGADIIAQCSGTIESIITREGTPMVHEGDVVNKGDILISGCIEILGDDKTVTGYKYVKADADIKTKTEYSYQESISNIKTKKIYEEESDLHLNIKINDYYFQDYFVQRDKQNEDVIRKRISLTPLYQDILSIEVECENHYPYDENTESYTEEEVQMILTNKFQQYCIDLTKKKVEILEKNVKIYRDELNATAKGTLSVIVPDFEYQDTEPRELPEQALQEGHNE